MSEITILDEIKNAVESVDVLLFMKGSPQFPQCGFSSTVCQILNQLGIEFKSVDVLQNAEVRDGIKQFSNWPTIPQLYVKGEFLGGCDKGLALPPLYRALAAAAALTKRILLGTGIGFLYPVLDVGVPFLPPALALLDPSLRSG